MKLRPLFSALPALALFMAVPAQGQLATFDDLPGCTPGNTAGSLVPNGYSSFNWSNFFIAHGANTAGASGGAGYANGTVTADCIALNGFGDASEITSGSAFTFNGGFFTAAFSNSLAVSISGFFGATQLYSAMLNLNTSGPQLLDVAWAGVDRVTFASGDGRQGSQFVFDNFRFNNAPDPAVVPEPATLTLLASGVLGLGAVTLRRRRERFQA